MFHIPSSVIREMNNGLVRGCSHRTRVSRQHKSKKMKGP
jgi:hypothetical protein